LLGGCVNLAELVEGHLIKHVPPKGGENAKHKRNPEEQHVSIVGSGKSLNANSLRLVGLLHVKYCMHGEKGRTV